MIKKSWPDTDNYSSAHTLQFIQSGEGYFSRLAELIESSRKELHLQVYIFDEDLTGKYIAALLIKAAMRGVSVYVLADGFGSSLSDNFIEAMERSGIHFRKFNPLFSTKGFRLGRRLHLKVAVADRERALIGGINIADKYRGSEDALPWLDFAVSLEGAICQDIGHLCEHIWERRRKTIRFNAGKKQDSSIPVVLKLNDRIRRKAGISKSYRQALQYSKTEVTLAASYFFPGLRIRRLIRKAARRGVRVTLILPGISDVRISKAASTHLYAFLLRNGVHIYEWKHSVLHGKIAVADSVWTTIGSYNLNHLSDYGSIELNAEIADPGFAGTVNAELEKIKKKCEKIDLESFYRKQTFFGKLGNWLAYRIVRLLFNIVFLFTNKGE